MSAGEIETCIEAKRGELKEPKNAQLLGKIEVFACELKAREEQLARWFADPINSKETKVRARVDEDFKGDIEALAKAMQEREKTPPRGPRYSCYVISVAWNTFAQQQWGVLPLQAGKVATPSLTRVQAKFVGCVEARTTVCQHWLGQPSETKRDIVLLSFRELAPARAARLVLQEERVHKRLGWDSVQYARHVTNLFGTE